MRWLLLGGDGQPMRWRLLGGGDRRGLIAAILSTVRCELMSSAIRVGQLSFRLSPCGAWQLRTSLRRVRVRVGVSERTPKPAPTRGVG